MGDIIGVAGPNMPGGVEVLGTITKVDAFYNSAWFKLIGAIVVGGLIVVVVVPIVVRRLREGSFTRDEKKILEKKLKG